MAQTNADKQRKFREKQRENGLVFMQLWVKKDNKQAIKDFADKLDKGK